MTQDEEPFWQIVDVCERLANDKKAPVRHVDFAVELYDRLSESEASVKVWELSALSALVGDYENGLSYLAHILDIQSCKT
jgi:hypothetical protein